MEKASDVRASLAFFFRTDFDEEIRTTIWRRTESAVTSWM